MAINYITLKQNLYTFFLALVPMGMPVIWYEPNAPRPIVPYVTLFLNTTTQVNQDYSAPETDINGNIFMRGDRTFTLQLQAYGGEPLNILEDIRTSIQKQTVLDALHAAGIAYNMTGIINDITSLVDSQFERRAQMDLTMTVAQRYSDNPGYFDHLILQQIYLDPAGTIVYDELVEIPET